MRKNDYMKELRADESQQGPLKIIKLPSADIPIVQDVTSETPNTLRQYSFLIKGGTNATNELLKDDELPELEFRDINEHYEEIQVLNLQTEQQVMKSRSRTNSVYQSKI